MRKFDLSLRSSRSSYFATFRHQLTILSKTDALDEEKWLNMLGTFVKDWFRYESRSEERFSRNAETDIAALSLHDALPILLLLVYELNRSGLLAENEKIRPILAQLEKLLLCDLSPSTNDSVKN